MPRMQIAFEKMHGLGNDFVVIDTRAMQNGDAFSLSTQRISELGDRHTGIGFDQLLIVRAHTADNADIAYEIFNADGAAVNQCGNGARCIAAYVAQRDNLATGHRLIMCSPAGNVIATIGEAGMVAVDMGEPDFEPAAIPLAGFARSTHYALSVDGTEHTLSAVSIGNPHAVTFIARAADADVNRIGRALNAHAAFPEGVNAGFAEVRSRDHIVLRVFERGVGETRACGTGACAAMVTAHDCGLVDERVSVQLPGGTLVIDWRGAGSSIKMTGPTAHAFSGHFDSQPGTP